MNVSKKIAKTVLENPSRALDDTADLATAAAGRNPKKVLSSMPEVINLHHTGEGLYQCKIVKFMLNEWNKEVTVYIHQHHSKKMI